MFVSPESLVCSTVLAVENVGRDVQQLTVKTTDVDLPTGGQGKLKRGLRGFHLLSPFFFFFFFGSYIGTVLGIVTAGVLYFLVRLTLSHQTYS